MSKYNSFPKTGEGTATKIIDSENRFTNPNLHRRVEPTLSEENEGELLPRSYQLGIYDKHSYRTTITHSQNPNATDVDQVP